MFRYWERNYYRFRLRKEQVLWEIQGIKHFGDTNRFYQDKFKLTTDIRADITDGDKEIEKNNRPKAKVKQIDKKQGSFSRNSLKKKEQAKPTMKAWLINS